MILQKYVASRARAYDLSLHAASYKINSGFFGKRSRTKLKKYLGLSP
jgi:hypothetical protein